MHVLNLFSLSCNFSGIICYSNDALKILIEIVGTNTIVEKKKKNCKM